MSVQAHGSDLKDLSFEERIRLKQRSGFDHYVTKKSEILKRKEQREEFEKKVKKERESSKKQASSSKKQQKKQPTQKFSKLPVSIIRPVHFEGQMKKKAESYDPRFRPASGQSTAQIQAATLKNYDFIAEQQKDQLRNLKNLKRKAKSTSDEQSLEQIRHMIGEERALVKKFSTKHEQKELIDKVKQENRERAQQGLAPVFKKKRDLKAMQLQKKFDHLDKTGRLESFMKKKREDKDKKSHS